jgi:hypothetical protein
MPACYQLKLLFERNKVVLTLALTLTVDVCIIMCCYWMFSINQTHVQKLN